MDTSVQTKLGQGTQVFRGPRLEAPIRRRLYFCFKRLIDVLLASLFLVLLSPMILMIAILIKLDSPGQVIFGQQRMGYDRRSGRERIFTIFKFRSMYQGSDDRPHREYVKSWIHDGFDLTGPGAKLTNDQRITSFGRVLRATSLDELPQFWNVLRGDMTLVGPRPVPLYEVAEYNPWHRKRLEATPGITGLWQVRGRGRATLDEMARLDIEYIEHQCLWLDLQIMFLTVPAALAGHGAM